MAASPNVEVKVKWAPYFLSSPSTWEHFGDDAHIKGVEKRTYYDKKFGKGRIEQFMPRMIQAFEEAGCGTYTIEGRTGPTMDAHRLLTLAAKHNLQNELAEEFFKNYFVEGKTICDQEMLAESASKVGVPEAKAFLADAEAGRAEVLQDQIRYGNGVSGVPFFIIAGENTKETLSGAQPVDVFVEVFKKMAE